MNPKHITNLELSKQLFEAGVTKGFESEFVWSDSSSGFILIPYDARGEEFFPALLFDELYKLLPLGNEFAMGWNDATCDWTFTWGCRGAGAMMFGMKGIHSFTAVLDEEDENFDINTYDSPLVALSYLATYLLREGKFNNNKK